MAENEAWREAIKPFTDAYEHCHFENGQPMDQKHGVYGEPLEAHMRRLYELYHTAGQSPTPPSRQSNL